MCVTSHSLIDGICVFICAYEFQPKSRQGQEGAAVGETQELATGFSTTLAKLDILKAIKCNTVQKLLQQLVDAAIILKKEHIAFFEQAEAPAAPHEPPSDQTMEFFGELEQRMCELGDLRIELSEYFKNAQQTDNEAHGVSMRAL